MCATHFLWGFDVSSVHPEETIMYLIMMIQKMIGHLPVHLSLYNHFFVKNS